MPEAILAFGRSTSKVLWPRRRQCHCFWSAVHHYRKSTETRKICRPTADILCGHPPRAVQPWS